MTQESRRKVLKGIAVTLPATWITPVVESVILPAHAGGSPGECSAAASCYEGIDLVCCGIFYVGWPGGSGKKDNVPYWRVAGCPSEPGPTTGTMAVAASASEAGSLLDSNTVVKLVDLGDCGIWEHCISCSPDAVEL